MSIYLQRKIQAPSVAKPSLTPLRTGLLQRKCRCGGAAGVDGKCTECRSQQLRTQRSFTGQRESFPISSLVHEGLRASSQPLDSSTRTFMESRFGHHFSQLRVHPLTEAPQTQLTVHQPGDPYEREADQIADRVMRKSEDDTPEGFEPGFRYDFSRVRIHTDTHAAESARALNALAYTVGQDIVFGTGQYAPQTATGRRLLAHELAHTIQQPHNRVARLQATSSDEPGTIPTGEGSSLSIGNENACDSTNNEGFPLIHRGLSTPLRFRPAVGYAQTKLNTFLALVTIYMNLPFGFIPPRTKAFIEQEGEHLTENPLTVDCKFGLNTEHATKMFQAYSFPYQPEEWDGRIGPKTWPLLDRSSLPQPPPPGPAPTPPGPTPSAPTPILDSLDITDPIGGPKASIAKGTDTLSGAPIDSPDLACKVNFKAVIKVEPRHEGTIFFRQYIEKLIRKDDACGRGPQGVEKGPAIDNLPIYNHPVTSQAAKCTDKIPVLGGEKKSVSMTEFDQPFTGVSTLCHFKADDKVFLFAHDSFRLLVMWLPKAENAPSGSFGIPLGHRDWQWSGKGSFDRQKGSWITGVSDPVGPKASSLERPGQEFKEMTLITNRDIWTGKKKVAPF